MVISCGSWRHGILAQGLTFGLDTGESRTRAPLQLPHRLDVDERLHATTFFQAVERRVRDREGLLVVFVPPRVHDFGIEGNGKHQEYGGGYHYLSALAMRVTARY